MRNSDCIQFLRWAMPRLGLQWAGHPKVRGQMSKRLHRRLNELGLPTVDHYRSRPAGDPAEWAILDGLCHITISRFYRDKPVFDVLGTGVPRSLAGSGRLWKPFLLEAIPSASSAAGGQR